MVRAGLRAGIIVGIVDIVVQLLMIVIGVLHPEYHPLGPLIGCLWYLSIPASWFASGILAARFGTAGEPTSREAAGAGALAGAVTQVVVRIGYLVTNLIMLALGVMSVRFSPGTIQGLAALGLGLHEAEFVAYGIGPHAEVVGAPAADRARACMVCSGIFTVVAAGLGALGSVYWLRYLQPLAQEAG